VQIMADELPAERPVVTIGLGRLGLFGGEWVTCRAGSSGRNKRCVCTWCGRVHSEPAPLSGGGGAGTPKRSAGLPVGALPSALSLISRATSDG
jgi:hypothetical protein